MFKFSMMPLVFALFVMVSFPSESSAQMCSSGPMPRAINFSPECALQAAQTFGQCRASGGSRFGCLFQAGIQYWGCSGSTFTRTSTSRRPGRLRAMTMGARAIRRGR